MTEKFSVLGKSHVRKDAIEIVWAKLGAMSPGNAKLIEAHKKFLQDYAKL